MSESGDRSSGLLVEITVPHSLDGERVDRVVAMLTGLSRSRSSSLVESSHVMVNGMAITKPSSRVVSGDALIITGGVAAESSEPVADPSVEFGVVYEDEHVVVVDKPAGLVVHPGAGNPDSTLVNGLLHRYPGIAAVGDPDRPGIVHRLDRGTSGLMVVALTQMSYETLVSQLGAHEVRRTYTALVIGHPEHRLGVVDAPIGRSRRDPLKMTISVDGREARTHYELDRRFSTPMECSLVTCRLETGRTHQIRVHMTSIGHPVVGDGRYGGLRGLIPLGRPFLHARELAFTHPASEQLVAFESDLPPDLAEVVASLA